MSQPPIDDELEDIFKRPSDVAFAQRLYERRQPMVEADPAFKEALRRRLMQEAEKQRQPRRPWFRRLLGPPGLAWAGAMAGVLLIVFATVTLSQSTGGSTLRTFTSPQNGHRVATTASIVVNFPQPMNPTTTEAATKITPATEARYKWTNSDQTLTITPKNDGLAPGVQYQVTFAASARTASNQPLAQAATKPAPITFVTQQPPPPTPPPTPSTNPVSPVPTPPPSLLSNTRELGPSGSSQPVWSQDGSLVYVIGPSGQLTGYPVSGGAGTAIQASGVTQVAVGPDGVAYLAGDHVTYNGETMTVPGVTSIGFENTGRGLQLAAVAGTTVAPVGASSGLTLKSAPRGPVPFSPNGSNLAYLAPDGLHLVTLSSKSDRTVGPATGIGAWSPDGSQLAFVDQGALSVLDVSSGTTTQVSGLSDVGSVSWTVNGLLVSSSAGLQSMTSPTGTRTTLAPAAAAASAGSWSPASAVIGYVKGRSAYVASVDSSSALSAVSDAVTKFMAARRAGNVSEASSLLTPAGQADFNAGSGPYLTNFGSQVLSRWSMVLAQASGAVVVRTVFSQGTQESVFDEQFQLAPATSSGYLIERASATGIDTGGTAGPAIQRISVSPTSIAVKFDSDVNPAGIASGVAIQNAAGSPLPGQSSSYNAATRTVTISFPALTAGQQYELLVGSALKDVDGNPATPVQLTFTSSTSPPPMSASTSPPSPSPTPGG
ncbi:MAG: Ig-like domain-containing protein [Candidatus Dormibacteraceae bacterium]